MRREENVSAQQSAPEADPRVPRADADPARPGGAVAAAAQGPGAPERLTSSSPPPVSPPVDESLRRTSRVRRGPEYLRAYRRGRRRSGALMILHYVPNEAGIPRLSVTVSRKVGDSVALRAKPDHV